MRIFASGWSFDKDGPGQRLVFYLKGCNMRCGWCANPEGISPEREILFYPERCSGNIDYVCSKGAIDGKILNREICKECSAQNCVKIWRHKCIESVGEEISPEKILTMAEAALDMFGRHGGVTFGGGEPTLQSADLLKTMRMLRDSGISTAVESNASTGDFALVAQAADYLICDLKAFSDKIHSGMTGVSSRLVLENLIHAGETKAALLIRIPVVTGLNDGQVEITLIVDFLTELHQRRIAKSKMPLRVELLRMHHLSRTKYAGLGIHYPMDKVKLPDQSVIAGYRQQLSAAGIAIIST